MLSLQLLHLIPDSRSHRITVIIPFAKTSVGNPQVVVFHDSRIHRLAITVLKARAQTIVPMAIVPRALSLLLASPSRGL